MAVGSRDLARAQAYASEHGIPRVHGSYEDLLADPEVDAVYIPLPNSLHVPWAVRALEAGKHVLCEKPLSRDPAQVEVAFDAAERARAGADGGVHVALSPADRRAGAARPCRVRSATCALVRTAFGFGGIGGTENVRLQTALEGGALMDVGCYCVSALRLLCGEPTRVSGEQVLGGDGGIDIRFAGTLRFAGDVVGTFDCGMDVHRRHSIEVVGSRGHDPRPLAVADAVRHRDPRDPRGHRADRPRDGRPVRARARRGRRRDRRRPRAAPGPRRVTRPGARDRRRSTAPPTTGSSVSL